MRSSQAILSCRPADIHPSHLNAHELLVHGGYIARSARGVYTLLPLGMQVIRIISAHIHREMRGLGGHEVRLPLLEDQGLWQDTGRLKLAGDELVRFRDSKGSPMVLAPTHELGAMLLFKESIRSTRELPAFIYQTQIKVREDPSDHPGLDHAREFIMHDGYSLHGSFASLNNFIPRVYKAYTSIFASLGIRTLVADSLAKHMRGDRAYDFFLAHKQGHDGLAVCPHCGYTANRDTAAGFLPVSNEAPLPLQTVVRLSLTTMDSLAKDLGIPPERMARARLYWGFTNATLVVFRADQEPSMEKLSRITQDTMLREATEDEIRRLGLDSATLSPFGLRNRRLQRKGLRVVVDKLVAESANLIMPVNEEHSYVINANFGRDFDADITGDICRVNGDFLCHQCNGHLEVRNAMKLASIMRLGEFFASAMEWSIRGLDETAVTPSLGAYSINMYRVLLALVESNRSPRGFLWPTNLSPYKALLMPLGCSPRITDYAAELHQRCGDLLLYEDRELPWFDMVRTADALGIRIRIVITRATLETGTVQILDAALKTKTFVPTDQLRPWLLDLAHHDQEL